MIGRTHATSCSQTSQEKADSGEAVHSHTSQEKADSGEAVHLFTNFCCVKHAYILRVS